MTVLLDEDIVYGMWI